MSCIFRGATALLAVALALSVRGAGFEYGTSGARAQGMAGASIAMPDDGSAVVYNPAALAAVPGAVLTLDNAFSSHEVSFQRTDAAGNPNGNQIGNGGGLFYAPFVTMTYALFDGLTLAAGAFGPPSVGRYSFPDPADFATSRQAVKDGSPQRYMSVSRNNQVIYPTVAVGWRPLQNVYVGASAQIVKASFALVQHTWVNLARLPEMDENPNNDLRVDVKAANGLGDTFTGVLGLSVKASDGLFFGASYRPRFDVEAAGTFDTKPLFPGLGISQSGNKIALTVPFPDVLRGGVDLLRGNLHAAFGVTYETWGRVDHLTVDPTEDINFLLGAVPVGKLARREIELKWQDSFSARLGAEYKLGLGSLSVTPRAGALFESSAVPASRTQIGYANWERFGANAGATVRWRGYGVTAGYSHLFQSDVSVRTSEVRGSAVGNDASGTPTKGSVVGNGDYHASYDLVSVALQVDFTSL